MTNGKVELEDLFSEDDNTTFQPHTSLEEPKKPKPKPDKRIALYDNRDYIWNTFLDRDPTPKELKRIGRFLLKTFGKTPEREVARLLKIAADLKKTSSKKIELSIEKTAKRWAGSTDKDQLAYNIWTDALEATGMTADQAHVYIINLQKIDALKYTIESLRKKQTQHTLLKTDEDISEDLFGTA